MDSGSLSRSGKSAADPSAAAAPAAAAPAAAGSAADGLVLLDKPDGITSFQCLGRIKRVLGTRRVGHVGTLDPFASGLLGVVTGRATRLAGLLSGLDKRYLAGIRFGLETDTLDPEGAVIGESPVPDLQAIRRVLPAMVGRLRQRPPAYSAVHVAGRRAYALARRGEVPLLPLRDVTVSAAHLIDWQPPDLTLELTCSAGTYVRSWARDLGVAAGSRAYVAQLRRLSIGPFGSRDCVVPGDFRRDHVLPPAAFLSRLPGVRTLRVRPQFRRCLVHGQPVDGRFFTSDPEPGADCYAAFDADDRLLAVLRWRPDSCLAQPAAAGVAAGPGATHLPDRNGNSEHPAPAGWSYAGVFADG